MAHTCRTARKSTGRLPVGQLAPQNVPQSQESQPDIPQEATPEEEPFEIELVVPESPTTQDSPAEEQQPEDHSTEDKTDEEQLPSSDTKPEKLYRDADELCWSTWASPPLPGTESRKSRVQGEWSSRPSQRFSSDPGFSANTRDQPSGLRAAMLLPMLPGRLSHHGSVATRAGCRTRSTTSYLTGRRINSSLRGEKGYSLDGDGTPPGCGGGAEHSSAYRSARD
jgi:hypothetical protein